MKLFLTKTSLIVTFILILVYLTAKQADGLIDPYYLKIATPKQTSMIVGTSRASQGIHPGIINESLKGKFEPTFNFAFTNANSPYGEVYFKAIKEKLSEEESAKNRFFIVAVSPWSISVDTTYENLREVDLFLDELYFFNGHPNFDYLFNHYSGSKNWSSFLPFVQKKRTLYLHDDGYLEVTVEMNNRTELSKRTDRKIDSYIKILPYYSKSEYRIEFLKKTIDLFGGYGCVFIVQLPISQKMWEIEQNLMPDFNHMMEDLSATSRAPYFSFAEVGSAFEYIDGNHLYMESAKDFSKMLADSVARYPCAN